MFFIFNFSLPTQLTATSCTNCETGKYNEVPGAPTCTDCGVGTFLGATGSPSRHLCASCPIGTYSNSPGTPTCSDCSPGHYTSGTGTVTCTECSPGKATPFAGNSSCADCAIGRYQLTSGGNATCTACAAGTIATSTGSPICISCAGGKYESGERTACFNCAEGTASNPGASECTTCESGKFNDEVKQDSCRSCDKFGVKNSFASSSDSPPSSKLSCICSKGDFRVLLNSSSAVLVAECQPCEGITSDSGISKEGLICNEVGLTTETLKLSPGYWRSGNSSVKIEMCENVGDCPQKNVTQQCADGQEGPICANCLPGHTRSVSGGCEECEETSSSSMLMLLACLILLSLILSRVLKRRMKNTSVADVHNKKHWANRLKTKVKILSSSFQIVCEFAATLKVSFPPVFSGFTKWVSTFVQFDFISIGSFGCMMETNYYGSLLIYTLAPIVITLLLVVYILLGKVMHRR